MRCLVTGANGFVGSRLIDIMSKMQQYQITLHSRSKPALYVKSIHSSLSGEIDGNTLWRPILDNIDYVIHCAARVHIMEDYSKDPITEFRRVNVLGTLNLARQCANAGVKRFIYLSSIGVNGVKTKRDTFFTETDIPNPHNPYAISKWEAEVGLMAIARESKLEVVIIRAPLIYGPNAPGNFRLLLWLVKKGMPIPLAGIRNQRSLIALDNLIDFILTCISHPRAANELFLISDGEDLSTPNLIEKIAIAAQVPNRLFYVPPYILIMVMGVLGFKNKIQGLCGSLRIDIAKARYQLGWSPPSSLSDAIHSAVSKSGDNSI